MHKPVFRGVSVCFAVFLPGRSSNKVSIQQAQLAEQNSVDKRHSGQLLQREVGLKLEFLLFHEESHFFSIFTRIKHWLSWQKKCF